MSRVELETLIAAPRERCYDLSLSVEVHLRSTERTGERVVAGVTSGVLQLGDEVTWEARHFGVRLRLATRISAAEPPRMFRDEMVSGPFRRLCHEHFFEPVEGGTRMRDVFEFTSGLPPLDALVLKRHLRRLLLERNAMIRQLAEGEGWREFVPDRPAAPVAPG